MDFVHFFTLYEVWDDLCPIKRIHKEDKNLSMTKAKYPEGINPLRSTFEKQVAKIGFIKNFSSIPYQRAKPTG